jgi:hypothetical protein
VYVEETKESSRRLGQVHCEKVVEVLTLDLKENEYAEYNLRKRINDVRASIDRVHGNGGTFPSHNDTRAYSSWIFHKQERMYRCDRKL